MLSSLLPTEVLKFFAKFVAKVKAVKGIVYMMVIIP